MRHELAIPRRNGYLVVVKDDISLAGKVFQEEVVMVTVEGVVPEIEVESVDFLAIDGCAPLEIIVESGQRELADAIARLKGGDACQALAHVVAQGHCAAFLATPQQIDAIGLPVGACADEVVDLVAVEQQVAAAHEQERVARSVVRVHDGIFVGHRVVSHDDGVLLG